jgi:hypothetical protein
MTGFAIGAHDHSGAQLPAEFPFPHLERAGGGEFVVVKMGMDGKDFHAMRPSSNHARAKAASRFCRAAGAQPV